MLPEQKQAWYMLVVFGLAVLVTAVLVALAGRAGWGGLGICGLAGLSPLLFRRRRQPGEVSFDERARMIHEKSVLAGGMTSYLVFIAACMVRWFWLMVQAQETMSIHYLPFVVVLGAIALMVTQSVVTLVLYGREADGGQD